MDEAVRKRPRDNLSEATANALTGCIRSEQNEEAREVLAMTFCDEILIAKFVHRSSGTNLERTPLLRC